jgi:hypothetical protein
VTVIDESPLTSAGAYELWPESRTARIADPVAEAQKSYPAGMAMPAAVSGPIPAARKQ